MNHYFDDPHGAGTREDPHAQARTARGQPLLLHSMELFRELFTTIFSQRSVRTIVEIGVESGQVSGMYADLGAESVYCVEPEPTAELRANLAGKQGVYLVEDASPRALESLPVADLYVVDGDHNYAVVRRELDWIVAHAPQATVVLHDVLWPCSRRDQYYQPSTLADEERHPDTAAGATVWHDALTPAGFVGEGAFTAAREAGGERNGVLTAVEDALTDAVADPWDLAVVPAVFGVAVMVRRDSAGAADVLEALRPYTDSALLAAMENNRIALYCRVLEMQYAAATHAVNADQFAETINAQQGEIDNLRREVEESAEAYQAQLDQVRAENRRLQAELADARGHPLSMVNGMLQPAARRVRALGKGPKGS